MAEIIDHPNPVPGHPVPGMHIWGLVGPGELTWLSEKAAQMSSIVEIGSMHGRSSFALLTACRGPVYCIDPWDDADREEYLNPPGKSYDEFMKNCGHFPNLVPIRGLSPEAAYFLPERMIDMVWLDGKHDFNSVTDDLLYWAPRTHKLICGHDYGSFPDVQRAVQFYSDCNGRQVKFTDLPGNPIWYIEMERKQT